MGRETLLCRIKVVVNDRRRRIDFPVLPVGAVLTIVITVANVLHVAVAVVRGARSVAVASVVVALAAIILARRVVATSATGGRAAAAAWGTVATRRTDITTTAIAVGSGLEAPRGGWGSAGPLDLELVVTSDPLVVHFVVGFIGVAAALVFDEGKEATGRRARGGNVAADKAAITLEFVREIAGARAVAEARYVESSSSTRH